ncbi:hypothetical protein ElyMa_003308500 [Elysia marginata]|uniref:Uncharacterized protein n=1 Tax=Elysia marginata TaxID=1093978 RepID=A0AAV4JFN0_9GAST|nr:hypothetical protein ElyMa_003308500 [Elysia marginata]
MMSQTRNTKCGKQWSRNTRCENTVQCWLLKQTTTYNKRNIWLRKTTAGLNSWQLADLQWQRARTICLGVPQDGVEITQPDLLV